MKQITIISGKGGTGKTTVASNFIKLANEHVAADCDVDAANLNILLNTEVIKKDKYVGGKKAKVSEKCINCGKCEEACRFDAISDSETDIKIDELRCEGCGVCEYVCPVNAIKLVAGVQGYYFNSKSNFCNVFHAELNPGAENSGLLVTKVRNDAEDFAVENNKKVIIIDGAPGIGCPVISSLNGVDYTLIVVEPTISGISDFKKVYEVTKFFDIKTLVCINKYDLNEDNTKSIIDYCKQNKIGVVGKIPYDEKVPYYLSNKKFVIDDKESIAGKEIRAIWKEIKSFLYED